MIGLLGDTEEERNVNIPLGLLHVAAGAFSQPQNGMGGALTGGLNFLGGLQQQRAAAAKAAEQKRLNDSLIGYREHLMSKQPQRRIVKGADGFNYYTDTGERVFPGIKEAKGAAAKPFQFGQPMADADNNFIGWGRKNPNTGIVELIAPDGKTVTPMPEGARPQTTTGLDRGVMKPKDFYKKAGEAVTEAQSIEKLQGFWKNVKGTRQGVDRLVDQFNASIKTLLGSSDLTPEEFKREVANGQLQGLIGRMRLETVGGGVMTEKDAERIIMAVGGNLSALQNKAVAGRLIANLLKEKIQRYNTTIRPMYEHQRRYYKHYPSLPEFSFDPKAVELPKDASGTSAPDDPLGIR